jgi:diacylglycerol O-acyltransferase
VPSASTLAVQALIHQTQKSANAARSALRLAREVRSLWSVDSNDAGMDEEEPARTLILPPREPFNGSLSTRRTISRASARLEDLRYVKKTFDTTINDVVLAASTLALRSHLGTKTGSWQRPLIAAVPVSTRHVEHEPGGNHVSSLFVRLPVYLRRAEDIIRTIRINTLAAKQAHSELKIRLMETALEVAPPAAVAWIARQHERLGLANWHPPPCNLIVSNIAGPPIPLYFAGAQVQAAYPFGPLVTGSGLNLTVMSYRGRMNFGLIACPQRMPHAERFVSDLVSAVTTLCEAADRVGNR